MSRGNHLSLEEARKLGKLDRFCKEHPSQADSAQFEQLLDAMIKNSPAAGQTSGAVPSEDCSGTRTRPNTSEDA